ncbi:MAG: MBL fold metallo-hydrolase [Lentisphaeria bacterium]|nr:MBL fold metallo-hydrolase [Lentisphaeria bacterium]
MKKLKITILTENEVCAPLKAEHGLSMLVEYEKIRFIFDFGMSAAWKENADFLQINISDIKYAFLSHGHNDHTGGLKFFNGEFFCAPGIDKQRYSHHPGKPIRNLSMPDECKQVLKNSKVNYIDRFTEIFPGVFCTGPIPRITNEDCGGPFFLDDAKTIPDLISDESALLFDNGVLLHGCCHSGIINTIELCKKYAPNIKIHTIIGGLHLLHASDERLEKTKNYLQSNNINSLYLMHCTGQNAISYLNAKTLTENFITMS